MRRLFPRDSPEQELSLDIGGCRGLISCSCPYPGGTRMRMQGVLALVVLLGAAQASAQPTITSAAGAVVRQEPSTNAILVRGGGGGGRSSSGSSRSSGSCRGCDVPVHGSFRSNGTYVQPHMRSAPNGTTLDNWSTRGNVNPYTGRPGTQNPNPPPRLGPHH
jgi:hypothetical protein